MNKSFNKIKEIAKIIDLFIVVLDARAPISTYNKNFDKIAPSKPRLFLISKIDLSDQNKLNKIIKNFNYKNDKIILANLKKNNSKTKILKIAKELLNAKIKNKIKKGIFNSKLYVAVIGVPNSGKSTLINLLSPKTKVNIANEPGITRHSTWINAGEMQIMDTPGILWPKFENFQVFTKLVIIGSVKISLFSQEEIFYATYKLLSEQYKNKIEQLNLLPAINKIKIYAQLIKLCETKKFFKKNKININQGINFFINYVKKLKGVTYD